MNIMVLVGHFCETGAINYKIGLARCLRLKGCTTMVPNISLSRRPVHVFFYSFNGDCLVVAVAVIWCDVCSVCPAVPSGGSGGLCTSPAQSHWFLVQIIPLYVVD